MKPTLTLVSLLLALLATIFVILVLAVLARWLIHLFKYLRLKTRYQAPKRFEYNVVVIGGGAAGLTSASIAARAGAKVALVEKNKMGGDCLNTGCVPSKALIRSARVFGEAKRAQKLGFTRFDVAFDFSAVMNRVQSVIRQVEPKESVKSLSALGVECLVGDAHINTPFEVQVGGRKLTTRNIIVASGATPFVPPLAGLDKVHYLTSSNLWELREIPKRLLVLGGGAIGCELSQSFARFGSQVTLIDRSERIMRAEDADASKIITDIFTEEGIRVLGGYEAQAVKVEGERKCLVCHGPNGTEEIEFDEIVLALGRKPNVTGFGLEALGVKITQRGTIGADQHLRTNIPNIFVCGDVAGPYQFVHTAVQQAWHVAANALFAPFKWCPADYRVIPWSTFTDPEVARVGLNEQEASQLKIPHQVSIFPLGDLDRAATEGESQGFVKVLTEPGCDRILGATIVASRAGDMIVEFVTAMKHRIGLSKIRSTIHIYPTFGEANRHAAEAWKFQQVSHRKQRSLKRFHAWRRGEGFLG